MGGAGVAMLYGKLQRGSPTIIPLQRKLGISMVMGGPIINWKSLRDLGRLAESLGFLGEVGVQQSIGGFAGV